MKDIEDKSVDMILCDLPYGTTQNKWDSIIPLDKLWLEYKRIIKDNRAIVLTCQTPFDKVLGSSNLNMLRYEWIWAKNKATGHLNANITPMKEHENILVFYEDLNKCKTKQTNNFIELRRYFLEEQIKCNLSNSQFNKLLGNEMASHYFSIKSQWVLPTEENYKKLQVTGYFNKSYEILKELYKKEQELIHLSLMDNFTYNPQGLTKKTIPTIRKGKSGNGSNYGKSDKDAIQLYENYPKDLLYFESEHKPLHPTQKPVLLMEYLIKTYTNEGETVLDNCIGSGTTAVASINTNRNFIGIEKDETYFEVANKRIVDHTKAVSSNGTYSI